MSTTKKASRDPRQSGLRLVVNGRAQGATLSRLSNFAYFWTAGIGGTTVERIGVNALVALLAKLGVKDPYGPGWQVELPNGVTVAAVLDDHAVVAAEAQVAAKPKAPVGKAARAAGATSFGQADAARQARQAAR